MTLDAQASSSSLSSANDVRPSAHAQRYDRQLRLWASSGQASLESARIVVLGASYLSASVLKNLVLPGVGAFDIVDARTVDEADLGSNFFVQRDAKGKSRAFEVARNLCELNPQVRGQGIEQEPHAWLEQADLDAYTMIVAVNQPLSVLRPLSNKAWHAKAGLGIPLMTLRGAGLIGELCIQVNELGIVETHPDNTVDLRLTQPWKELRTYAQSYDIETKDSMEHSHTPYIVLLLRKLQEWKEAHASAPPQPSSSEERTAFVHSINAFRWGESADEENVDEALAALGQHVWRPLRAGEEARVPGEVSALFTDEQCTHITSKSSNFWLLVRALKEFVEQGEGSLPLPGSLPDFKALSATYVSLQRIYRAKAAQDVLTLQHHLHTLLEQVGLPKDAITQDEVESFAKHAAYIRLVRGRTLNDVLDAPDVDAITNALMDPINPITVPWYVALVASQDFYANHHNRYPGSSLALSASISGQRAVTEREDATTYEFEKDNEELVRLMNERLTAWRLTERLDEDQSTLIHNACAEITRSGHADLPSTSALLGGIAAQEAIKLVTRQYVPFDNTAVYDGITQAIGVFRL